MAINFTEYNSKDKSMLAFGTGNDNMFSNGEFLVAQEFIRRGDIVFDIGANHGNWLKMILSVKPLNNIYAFEPIKELCQHISIHHHFRENIKIVNGAVSDQVGETDFYIYRNSPQMAEMSNMFGRPEVEQKNNINVLTEKTRTITIDHLFEIEKLEKVNFVKIDTEGAEELVLNGATKTLGRGLVDHIQFEYGGCFIDSGASLKRIFELLAKHNFTTFRILHNGLMHFPKWNDELENYLHSNYFAIRSCSLKPTIFDS